MSVARAQNAAVLATVEGEVGGEVDRATELQAGDEEYEVSAF